MSIPKVNIKEFKLCDNNYIVDRKKYSVLSLIEHSNKYKSFDLPLAGINLREKPWEVEDIDDFIFEVNRVKKSSLEYPILIDQYGTICDGWHRICKAIILGNKTIKAIRLESMPPHIEEMTGDIEE